jgi:hypothetical protein
MFTDYVTKGRHKIGRDYESVEYQYNRLKDLPSFDDNGFRNRINSYYFSDINYIKRVVGELWINDGHPVIELEIIKKHDPDRVVWLISDGLLSCLAGEMIQQKMIDEKPWTEKDYWKYHEDVTEIKGLNPSEPFDFDHIKKYFDERWFEPDEVPFIDVTNLSVSVAVHLAKYKHWNDVKFTLSTLHCGDLLLIDC